MADRGVEWTDAAREDLRSIVFHIAQDSPAKALSVADRLERRAATLAVLSTRGRVVPELRRVGEVRFREVIEEPWRIIHPVEGMSLYIVAVVDGRRDVQAWLNERMARFGVPRR